MRNEPPTLHLLIRRHHRPSTRKAGIVRQLHQPVILQNAGPRCFLGCTSTTAIAPTSMGTWPMLRLEGSPVCMHSTPTASLLPTTFVSIQFTVASSVAAPKVTLGLRGPSLKVLLSKRFASGTRSFLGAADTQPRFLRFLMVTDSIHLQTCWPA